MTSEPLPSMIDLTPLNETYRADPHVVLDDLRARCPVHRDEVSGSFIVSRYADVRAIVSDRGMWRDAIHADETEVMQRQRMQQIDPSVPRTSLSSILTLDDPDHARIRQPLAQALYARVARCRPQVEAIVAQALDGLQGQVDLMDRFCVPIPIDVIAAILGVDHDRLVEFRAWSEGVIQGLNPFRTPEQTQEMERASLALNAYFTETITARRKAPRDDLISDMTRLQAEGVELNDDELRINLSALLVGGNLTTTDLIGNAVRLLLLNPDELAKLRADPGIINGLVEEVLRYEPPVDVTGRIASQPLEFSG